MRGRLKEEGRLQVLSSIDGTWTAGEGTRTPPFRKGLGNQ